MDNNELKAKLAAEKTNRIKSIGTNATIIAAIITSFVTVFSLVVDIRKDNHDHFRENTKIELGFAEKFMDTALEEDINLRLRFSEYLMYIHPTADQRERWKQYYQQIKKQQERDSLEIELQE